MDESKNTEKKSSVGSRAYLELEACASLGNQISVKSELRLQIMRELFKNKGVSLKNLRKCHYDLDESLATLERYSEGLGNVPFAGDMGAGSSKAMPVRYYAKQPIMDAVSRLMTELEVTYVNLILAFLDKTDAEVSSDQIDTLLDIKVQEHYPQSFLLRSRAHITKKELRESFPEFYRLKSRDDIWQSTVAIFRDHVPSFPVESLSPADGLSEHLGMDSLDLFEFILDVEEKLGIDLSDGFGEMELTVGNLARLLENRLPPDPSNSNRS